MNDKLYIIGNGFDLAHKLPTKFDPDFKNISEKYETGNFRNIYQSKKDCIWSDFENLLANPDFESLETIFDCYEIDYLSDRESDRSDIIYEVELNGKLKEELYEFSKNAEDCLHNKKSINFFSELLDINGYYISFNYTHTLEYLYKVPSNHILHIHGEVGKNNLKLGYTYGQFKPEECSYYSKINVSNIQNKYEINYDYYYRTAFKNLYDKCKSFYKAIRIDLLEEFFDDKSCEINEIIVYGHSCAIDFDYFNYICKRYPNANWKFYIKDRNQKLNIIKLISRDSLKNTKINKVE